MKDCELVPVAKGICSKHYSRAQRKRYRLSIPVEEIIAAVESGKTQREIAKKYHVSRMVIASRLKAVGYQSPNAGPRPKLNTEEALQVIEQYGITEAARRLEVSTGAVQSLLDRKQIARFTTVPTQRRGLEAEEIRKLHALHSKIPEKNSGLDLHSMEAGEFFSYCLQLHARNVPMSRMSEELNHARSWITNSLHKLGRAPVPRKVDSLTTQARKKRASRNP